MREGLDRQAPGNCLAPFLYQLSNMVPSGWRVQQEDKLGWPAIRKDRFVRRPFRLAVHVGAHEVRVPLELVGRGTVSSSVVANHGWVPISHSRKYRFARRGSSRVASG